MSSHYPFCAKAVLAATAFAAAALLTPVPARAQLAQQAAVGKTEAPKSEAAKSEATKPEATKPAEAPAGGTSVGSPVAAVMVGGNMTLLVTLSWCGLFPVLRRLDRFTELS